MGLFDSFKKSKTKGESKPDMPEYLYTEEEIEELDSFISERIGEYQYVFHEMASPDIHLDVCIVEPGEDEPYYKLVTMGAGAFRMRIPDAYEEYQLEHAEYIINLPKDWNINSGEEEHYWPIRLRACRSGMTHGFFTAIRCSMMPTVLRTLRIQSSTVPF